MKITLSVLKADIGSIGGHITPSRALVEEIQNFVQENGKDLLIDFYLSHTGDDIAILCTHEFSGPLYIELHEKTLYPILDSTVLISSYGAISLCRLKRLLENLHPQEIFLFLQLLSPISQVLSLILLFFHQFFFLF